MSRFTGEGWQRMTPKERELNIEWVEVTAELELIRARDSALSKRLGAVEVELRLFYAALAVAEPG